MLSLRKGRHRLRQKTGRGLRSDLQILDLRAAYKRRTMHVSSGPKQGELDPLGVKNEKKAHFC